MTTADYIAEYLISLGVTDTFGIPGGVILKLIDAFQRRKPAITPHLNYHEQMSGFAALGYAQASGRLGVAYATRGPGICNMMTCIAEAYQESIPALFITAHGMRGRDDLRAEYSQELPLASAVKEFTKYSAEINSPEEVGAKLREACSAALDGRRGPVFLDIASALLGKELPEAVGEADTAEKVFPPGKEMEALRVLLNGAERPVILIGDGLRYNMPKSELTDILDRLGIPVISSRGAQDIACRCENYYGYVGSHGTRYTNFILSKADLIVAIGNRLAFPFGSESFSPILKKKIFRVDADENEMKRNIDASIVCAADAARFLREMSERCKPDRSRAEWLGVCGKLKEALCGYDITEPVEKLSGILRGCADDEYVFVSDVGNNEFWFSRAFEYVRPSGSIVCSKNFGTLGSALGRAIGAYYASGKKVMCIIGDQGFQYNIQELQFISAHDLPIKLILLNNHCSGMIYDHERRALDGRYIHVYEENGYSAPDFERISNAYGIRFFREADGIAAYFKDASPLVCEIGYSKDIRLIPDIPKGNPCHKMFPELEPALNSYLESL